MFAGTIKSEREKRRGCDRISKITKSGDVFGEREARNKSKKKQFRPWTLDTFESFSPPSSKSSTTIACHFIIIFPCPCSQSSITCFPNWRAIAINAQFAFFYCYDSFPYKLLNRQKFNTLSKKSSKREIFTTKLCIVFAC